VCVCVCVCVCARACVCACVCVLGQPTMLAKRYKEKKGGRTAQTGRDGLCLDGRGNGVPLLLYHSHQ